jgi:hypothetical protein
MPENFYTVRKQDKFIKNNDYDYNKNPGYIPEK